jgi:hypothetical protein
MFANIAIQIAGYYVIAALCIPLGYGHLKSRWWAGTIMMTLLVDWLIIGLPLSLIAVMMLVTFKGVTSVSLPFVALGFILLYPVLPIMMLRFYRSAAVQRTMQAADLSSHWLVTTPQAVLVGGSLMMFLALLLHFPLLFEGFFPLFGHIVNGLPGILIVVLSIATSVILMLGILQRSYWSWWCALVFLGLITVSSSVTFLTVSPHDIIDQMRFAPLEIKALAGIPMRGSPLALFFGFIPSVTLAYIAVSHRYFKGTVDLAVLP